MKRLVIVILFLTSISGYSQTFNFALGQLKDVSVASPTINYVLTWNGSLWVAAAPGGGGSGITTLNTLTGATQTFSSTGITITSLGTNHAFSNNFSTGVSGGQTIIGGTAASNSLTYSSTSHATKGTHIFGTANGMVFDEATTKVTLNGQTATGQLSLKPASGGIGMFIRNTTDADIALLINSAAANQHLFYGNGNATLSLTNGYVQVGAFTTSGVKLAVSGTSASPGGAFFKGFTDADIAFGINNAASTLNQTKFYSTGSAEIGINGGNTLKVGGKTFIGSISAPTALLHIAAGTATANTAPQKFTAGVLNTTPESGAVETNPSNELFYSNSTTAASRGYVSLGRYESTATSLTADATQNVIDVTATGQTITLPTSVGLRGRTYTIKLTAAGTGTVATTSSQTIDGSTTYSLSAQYKYVTVMSDNANWIIIGNN